MVGGDGGYGWVYTPGCMNPPAAAALTTNNK
jgi:hypothetical protein